MARFGAVGIVSLLVYSSSYVVWAETTHLGAAAISMIAYVTAMVVSFIGHKYVTFQASGNIKSQIFLFIVVHGVCLSITVLITNVIVNTLRWPYGIAILLVDIIIPLFSFFALKLVVFMEDTRKSISALF